MEHVLGVYHSQFDADEPVVCMDETTKQLTEAVIAPTAAREGRPERYDTLYKRNGVGVIFMFFEPLAGWRRVSVAEGKTRLDWAHQIKWLLDVDYPEAHRLHLVLDNLNTHTGGSLYEAFAPEEAHRLLDRLVFHYTPKHGSWLNMAEIELSVLSRQCLRRRIATLTALDREVEAWATSRNQQKSKATWRFKTKDARIKLRQLYPTVEE
jgi:hypothetical protein